MNFELKLPQGLIKIENNLRRALLLIPALLLTAGAIFSFGWFFGFSLAENAAQKEAAETAVFLAPTSPFARARLGLLKSQSFVPDDLPAALQELERAAALSPHDWRYWFAFAKMRERVGDTEGAELAARRAVELAPNYAQIRWLFGNILLRRGENREAAFNEMRRAAEADPTFAPPFVNAAVGELNSTDWQTLRPTLGEAAPIRAALVSFLTQNQKFDSAVEVWQTLPEKEKLETGKELGTALIYAKRFRTALLFYQPPDNTATAAAKPAVGRVTNGDFEKDITVGAPVGAFDWQIADGSQPQIALDATVKHGGAGRSLVILFNSVSGQEFRSASQTVAVASGAKYSFETFAKAGNLKFGGTLFWEILDAGDGKLLTKTAPAPVGDGDWQRLNAEFVTGSQTEAVTIRLARSACVQSPCSTTGKIWFDDFNLSKQN